MKICDHGKLATICLRCRDIELTTLRAELQAAKQTIASQEETIGGLEQNDAMLRAELATAHARIADLESVIEADRTRIIDGVNTLDKVLNGRFWLTEGRGSYEWNDDRYQKEFGDAARAVLKAVEPLRKIGADLTNCPPTTDEVIAARRNKDARIAELERALREWSELAEHLDLSTQSHRNRTRDLLATHAPEHPDTRRLDRLQSLGDNLELVIDGDLIGERIVLSWNAWSGRSLRDEIDAMKEAATNA